MTERERAVLRPRLGAVLGALERVGQCTMNALLPPGEVYSLTLDRTEQPLADPLRAVDDRLAASLARAGSGPVPAEVVSRRPRLDEPQAVQPQAVQLQAVSSRQSDVEGAPRPAPQQDSQATALIQQLLMRYGSTTGLRESGETRAEVASVESGPAAPLAAAPGTGARRTSTATSAGGDSDAPGNEPTLGSGEKVSSRRKPSRDDMWQPSALARLGGVRRVMLEAKPWSQSQLKTLAFDEGSRVPMTPSASSAQALGEAPALRTNDQTREAPTSLLTRDKSVTPAQPTERRAAGSAPESRAGESPASIGPAPAMGGPASPGPARLLSTGGALRRLVDGWQQTHPEPAAENATLDELNSEDVGGAHARVGDQRLMARLELSHGGKASEPVFQTHELLDEDRMAQVLERLLKRESERYGLRLEES